MQKKIFLICIMLLIIINGYARGNNINIKYNNDVHSDSMISKIYSEKDIDDLQNDLNISKITYGDLKLKFEIQCVRKTFQGYYIILKLETNRRAFLFLNSDLELTNVLRIEKFHRKSDFDFVRPKQTTVDEIVAFDDSTSAAPISSEYVTGHILSDGLLIIHYNTVDGKILLENPIVESIKFMNNEDMKISAEEFWIRSMPFILYIDRMI